MSNLSTVRTKDARAIAEELKNKNLNEVKTMLINNWKKEGQANLTRFMLAFREIHNRGISFTYGKDSISFHQ